MFQWLFESSEPWTRYRTRVDLLLQSEDDPEVQAARAEMLAHPQVQELITEATARSSLAIKRHNDAGHPIYKLSTLADFGVRATDPGMAASIEAVMAHQSSEGAFQSLVNVPQAFGGTGEDAWTWMLCDAPTLLYALTTMGLGGDARVQRAVDHLVSLATDAGWRCVVAPELGKFHGPGRREDPCPIVNVYALKALSQVPKWLDSPATHAGVEMILSHWANQRQRKIYMFGIGTDFRKLKYPFVWYDILHVVDVLSRYPFVHHDPRFHEMVEAITSQVDIEGHYHPGSMYKSWKDWGFADKKSASPWITFLVMRLLNRLR
jgi:hypothetical protein